MEIVVRDWDLIKITFTILPMVLVAAGCRCSNTPSEQVLPTSKASASPLPTVGSAQSCPARPAWAGEPTPDMEIELLHARTVGTKEQGTGYRLYRDGSLETFDTVTVEPDDQGRMVLKTVAGSWKKRGKVKESARLSLKKKIASQDPMTLRGKWRTTGSITSRTNLLSQVDEQENVLCYVGEDAPSSIQELQKSIHDLMGQLETATP